MTWLVFELIFPEVIDNAHRVGGWGGSCTCPDGQVYQVGDEHNHCGSLRVRRRRLGHMQSVNKSFARRVVEPACPL